MIEIDDEPMEGAVEIDEPTVIEEPKSKPQPKKKESLKEEEKKGKEPQLKEPQSKQPPKLPKSRPQNSPDSQSLTADQILQTIEDVHLPDDTGEKVNFFQVKQKQESKNNQQSTMSVDDIPTGKPNCLTGLTMVFTGLLPHFDREASENLAKRYGAKVTKSISKKTSVVVIGEEAGPAKVRKIKELKIKAIDEEGFVKLISSMPSEGGQGQDAQKAKAKREHEEAQAIAEAEKEMKEEQALSQQTMSQTSNSQTPGPSITDADRLWTVKYAPKDLKQICGNKGTVTKLYNWLSEWTTASQPRAVLISGPPGIGKTTAAHLVAKSLGYDILEKNASDVRSKSLLNSTVKSSLSNTSLVGYFKGGNQNSRKFCLIMDEVDGMSSGDHGGVGALAAFCRITSMPIILVCNDKSLPKMRPFDRVTLDLPFRRPTATEIKSRIMTIAHREHLKLDPVVIDDLVTTTRNDIRQIINLLSTVSRTQKSIGTSNSADLKKAWQKQVVLKPFDIVARLFSAQIFSPYSNVTLNDKLDLFFNDFDFTPLMVHENYRSVRPARLAESGGKILDHLKLLEKAADSISQADIVNGKIRSGEQQWSLLPFFGVMSSILPASYMYGQQTGRINFTSWLGQNSKKLKYQRLLQELQYHTSLKTSTDNRELRLSYMPFLISKLSEPLIDRAETGIDEVIDIMDGYYLTREDWDSIMEFGIGPLDMSKKLKSINTKTKSAFTRTYGSRSHPVAILRTGNSVMTGGAKQAVPDIEDVVEDDTAKDEPEEEVVDNEKLDLKKDKLVKEVKPRKRPVKKAKK